jgi:two-component system nitrate/nitrite response regulator NarL
MIRVFIAAHFRLYREGLAEILGREDGIAVIGSATYGRETVSRVRELQPDVVLLDPAIPESADAIRELADPSAAVRVIALASPGVEREMIAWAEAGVSGFVGFDDSLSDLFATIRGVARGDLLCSPQVAGSLLRRVTALAAERSRGSVEGQLTAREFEVIRLIDEGLSNKQIAIRLCIELPTVKHHVHHILEKVGAARRSEAVAALRQRGLLPGHTR